MDEYTLEETLTEAREKMARIVGHVREEFSTVRTGRASTGLIEKLEVEYYGTPVPLQQLATLSVPEPRTLVVAPFDKEALRAIEKAILNSNLGLVPSSDGQVLRIGFPPLTEERRKELVKLVKHMAEEGRISVRNLRRGIRHDLELKEKSGELSADDLARAEKEIEKVTHQKIEELDHHLVSKEHELLEV
ncbi:MAG: ribosome recycling factor [Actinomycetota bacterium]|jgi:ribosome recycling factor|nr:ribosome recycling factor [Actinomycetota bacterium]